MTPVEFPQSNVIMTAPDGLDESQVLSIPGFRANIEGGNLDGLQMVIVAWKPNEAEILQMIHGAPIFLRCIGGLPPHSIHTTFTEAAGVEQG